MTTIIYVHGYNASPFSFTWLQTQFSQYDTHVFSYGLTDQVYSCIEKLCKDVSLIDGPVILMGHSLGGVISLATAQRCSNVIKLITLNAPFGGIQYAGIISLFNPESAFAELSSHSSLLMNIRAHKYSGPHLAIVGERTMPLIREPNDGVVTLASQLAVLDGDVRYQQFPLNHFESLLSPDVAMAIEDFLK